MIQNAILFDVNTEIPNHVDLYAFVSCIKSVQPTALEVQSTGFVKHPVTKEYVSEFDGGFCLTVKTWKKEINSAAFKAKLEDRLERVDHEVTKKEKLAIKDQLLQEILPTILPKPSTVFMYYLKETNQIIVDTTSTTIAESAMSLLRKSLGSLPATPTEFPLDGVLSGHLEYCFGSDEQLLVNEKIVIGGSIKLKGKGNQGLTIKNMNLFDEGTREEVLAYITGGFKLKYIELGYIPNDVTVKLVDGYKLTNLSFNGFDAVTGEDSVSDWLSESMYCTSVISSIVAAINELEPRTDSQE